MNCYLKIVQKPKDDRYCPPEVEAHCPLRPNDWDGDLINVGWQKYGKTNVLDFAPPIYNFIKLTPIIQCLKYYKKECELTYRRRCQSRWSSIGV